MKTTIKIKIDDNKNMMTIHQYNVSECCDVLLNAYMNNQKIKCYINWCNLNKHIINLINIMANYIILKSTTIIDILLIGKNNKYSKCQIENLDFFLHIIFYNTLIVKNWMLDESKWKPLFILYKRILSDPHVMSVRLLSITWLISETVILWKMCHFSFLCDINFIKPFCSAIKKAYYKRKGRHFCKLAFVITHNYYVITHQFQENEFLYDKFKRMMDETLYLQRPQTNDRKCSKHTFLTYVKNYEFIKFIDRYQKLFYLHWEPTTLVPLSLKPFKACAYYNCNKLKTNINKIKMKICKGCKLTYYCSRKCQKIHWNSKHRTECQRLHVRANINLNAI